jgi:hypothetical protein
LFLDNETGIIDVAVSAKNFNSMQQQLGVKIGKAWDFVVVLHLAFIKVKMRA